LWKRSLFKKP